MTVVTVENEIYGAVDAIACEVSETELVAEMSYAPPAGSRMTITFGGLEWALAEVVGHVLTTDERRFVRMRFVRFVGAEDLGMEVVH